MNCLLGDAGIAIGLTSLPFRQETQFYYNEIVDALFPNYKNAVIENFAVQAVSSEVRTQFEQFFYDPVPYYLFGSFDLAVIALVDDFEMMARTFRAFDPMLSKAPQKDYRENFFYKVITGPTPQFKREDSIVKIAARTFLRKDRPPLFAMSLLKLNNALLLGAGTEFLRLVVRYVHAEAKRQMKENPNMQAILLESYSASEITLLVFTSSYSAAAKLITSVREARVRELVNSDSSVLSPEESMALLQNCMLKDLTDADDKVLDATLFVDTESYFGFDFRLLKPDQRHILERIDADDSMDLMCLWSVMPGHLHTSIDEFKEWKVTTCVGRGDLLQQATGLKTRQMISEVVDSLMESRPRFARRRQTTPAMSGEVIESLVSDHEPNAAPVDLELKPMSFSVQEISDIQDRLRAVWTPKILTGKVLNAFTNFNDGILDPALYGYFIELLPLMELIQKKVWGWKEEPKTAKLSDICATLEKVIDNFERAYRNRFYNSYRMGDITDFNLDFKGGIQQLITSFDAAYKAICSELGRPESFVYVAGSPGVYSTRYEVRLNYYHVFQPEIFASIANHEAANFYFTRYRGRKPPWFATAAKLIAGEDHADADKDYGIILRGLDEMLTWKVGDQRKMLPYIREPLFKYVFVDLLAFYFGYNRNHSLFAYWYWGYFAQTSNTYSTAGTISEGQFTSFMFRMRWIEKIAGLKTTETLNFGMPEFDRLYQQWRPLVDSFLDWLWRQDDLARWNNDVVSYVESRFKEIHSTDQDETVQQITDRLENEASVLRAKMEKGETCLYSRVDDQSRFKFTEQVLYAYLSLLAGRFGSGEILLDRQSGGRATIKPTSAKALFDPIGGIFTHDPETRRLRFRYRAGLTMSLWDMAQKEKKRIVLERLKRTQSTVNSAQPVKF